MITYEQVKQDPAIRTYIQKADESLRVLGFTEHSFAHVGIVYFKDAGLSRTGDRTGADRRASA